MSAVAATRTPRTDLPILYRFWSNGSGSTQGVEISYLCAEGKHHRCTGLIAPGGRAAYFCGCYDEDCDCIERAKQ